MSPGATREMAMAGDQRGPALGGGVATTVHVQDMHCAACGAILEKRLSTPRSASPAPTAWWCRPALEVRRSLKPGENEAIEFVSPAAGEIAYTCTMGMYAGRLVVEEGF